MNNVTAARPGLALNQGCATGLACMAVPFPSSGRMDAWQERRGLQTMNLRSVFTADQQRVLERYYDNGMTNQSKACFQLILQCAQETKLDFSVVRTWVGNKRRKLASKADQKGDICLSLSNHGLPGPLLSNHALAGGALSNHGLVAGGALVAGAMLTAELAAGRSVQNRPHLHPPSTSFPSSSSSSPSSSSPLGCGNNNNNNDVILTGIYSVNSAPRSRPRPSSLLSNSEPEQPSHSHPPQLNQSQHRISPGSDSRLALLQHKPPSTSPLSTSAYSASRRGAFPSGSSGTAVASGPAGVPHSWARQYGPVQARPLPSSQTQPRPCFNPDPPQTTPPRARVSLPNPQADHAPDHKPRIQQVFTLSGRAEKEGPEPGHTSNKSVQESPKPRPLDTIGCISIAMETGDEEDEWQREEESANMASQTHRETKRGQASARFSPPKGELSMGRGGHRPPFTTSRPWLYQGNGDPWGSYWVLSNSRKRTLQDRTQFSDGDLIQLKRYWDRGMTSLGSVCREKITAAADHLNVDPEIVKTWISNRRRKYRLMGIEIPTPKSGPAVFLMTSPGDESPLALSPEGFRTPELGDDLNDEGLLCLSEDGTNDSFQRDGEDGSKVLNVAPLANNVKIESVDEDADGEEGDGDTMASDIEQMQNLLAFKHEEVQFLESELLNQKQKYYELESFTKSLLNSVKSNDKEKQQELLTSLPQPADQEDWDMTPEEGAQPDVLTQPDPTDTPPDPNESSMTAEAHQELTLITSDEDYPGKSFTELRQSYVNERSFTDAQSLAIFSRTKLEYPHFQEREDMQPDSVI
ncbi:highly divergent homeobox [Aplochiton taeniatus]